MSIQSEVLRQARRALEEADRQRQQLMAAAQTQGKTIGDLEQEIQRQAGLLAYTQQLLVDARREIEMLRAQLPDAQTLAAYDELVRYLSASESERSGTLRPAA